MLACVNAKSVWPGLLSLSQRTPKPFDTWLYLGVEWIERNIGISDDKIRDPSSQLKVKDAIGKFDADEKLERPIVLQFAR